MAGSIVLQGGGPFVANDELDRKLFASHDRVVVLPTADAFEQPRVLVDDSISWGDRLGFAVEPLMVLTRGDADETAATVIAGSTAVMLVGDSGSHLRSVLKGTPVFAALEDVVARGGVVAAVAASAAALCDPMTDRRGGAFALGLGMVPGLAVLTEVETWSHDKLERAHALATTPVVDLPTGSALVKSADGWDVIGDAVVHGDLPD